MGLMSARAGSLTLKGVLVLLWLGPPTLLAQGHRDQYKQALEAVEVQNWQTAIALLRQAIDEEPTAKAGPFRRYIPHYYLGLSLYELGNCKAALTVWGESEKQGVVTRLKEYSTLQQGKAVCQKRIGRQEAANDLAELTGSAGALGELRDQPELAASWKQGDPSWNERFAAAQQLMAVARLVLEKSDSDMTLAELRKAREAIVSAGQQLEVIQTEARTQYKEVRAKLDVRSRLIATLLEEARQVLNSTAYLAPFPSRLGELRREVQRLIAEAGAAGQASQPDLLEDLRLKLSRALERLKQASAPPPGALLNAATAFFAADHDRVLEIVEAERFPSGRQAAHAHLLQAGSLYSLWVGGGEADAALKARASEAVRSCRAEDIALVPLEKAFSPRFIEFFFSEGQARAPIPLDSE